MPLSNIFQCNDGLGGLKGALSRTEYPLNNAGPQFRENSHIIFKTFLRARKNQGLGQGWDANETKKRKVER